MIEHLRHSLAMPDQLLKRIWHKIQSTSGARIRLYFIAGTSIWALYLMTVYPLTSLACHWSWFAATNNTGLKVLQVIITLLAAGLVANCGYLAFAEWQRAHHENNLEADEALAARNPLLAFVTATLNSLYLLIILVSLAPIFVLPACH